MSKRTIDDVVKTQEEGEDIKMEDVKPSKPKNCFSPQLLKLYYEYMFPADIYQRWLSYFQGPADHLWTHREFSFTSEIDGNEIYTRYRSFQTPQEFRKTLISRVPHKIDIGAVFNKPPKQHKLLAPGVLKPLERELIFDIDISDYDDVRTCCQDKQVCDRCWPLMNCAVKILNQILREDFGFEHLFFVFSGRRGIHCWVGDAHSRKLETTARSSIISYSSFTAKENKQEGVRGIHHMLKRAYDVCLPYFESCSIKEQMLLGDPTLSNKENERRIMQMLNLIPYPDLKEGLIQQFVDPNQTSEQRWKILKDTIEKAIKQNKKDNALVTNLRYTLMEIVLHYTYPRLDVEVTRHMNHLLKSPFCVHPKTGKLCIPIDPEDLDSFSPLRVPTLVSLTDELNDAMREQQKNDGEKKKIDFRSIPSMKREVEKWKKCFLNGLARDRDTEMTDLDW